jgi:magnesium-transporting ATPase (P-type)
LFSDKTGTLTKNEMVFKKFSIDKKEYTDKDVQLVKDSLLNDEKLLNFFKTLVLCHSISATVNQQNEIVYHAPSIDEGAFIHSTSKYGVTLTLTTPHTIEIDILGEKEEYQVLSVISFEFLIQGFGIHVCKKENDNCCSK